MHSQRRVMRRFVTAATAICLSWFATRAAIAIQDVQLTTVRGEASIADVALTERSQLPEDTDLTTGDDGNLSVLLDRNTVVELCGHSQVRFSWDATSGTRVVNIQAGEVKLIVEPRNAGERIEIHTPAAIATILGTVVYVSVDPVTGATTISSSQSQVNIRSIGDAGAAGTTINANEQLTIVPGEARQKKRSISNQQIAALTSCLLDFHELAAEIDRLPQETKSVERVAIADVGGADLPPIAAGRAAGPTAAIAVVEGGDSLSSDVEVELTPIDTNQKNLETPPPPPPFPFRLE